LDRYGNLQEKVYNYPATPEILKNRRVKYDRSNEAKKEKELHRGSDPENPAKAGEDKTTLFEEAQRRDRGHIRQVN
jgi:hypothetical protein